MQDKPLPDMADPILDRLTMPERWAVNLWYSHPGAPRGWWWWRRYFWSLLLAPSMWSSWRDGNIRALLLWSIIIVGGTLQAIVHEGFIRIVERYAREVRRLSARDEESK